MCCLIYRRTDDNYRKRKNCISLLRYKLHEQIYMHICRSAIFYISNTWLIPHMWPPGLTTEQFYLLSFHWDWRLHIYRNLHKKEINKENIKNDSTRIHGYRTCFTRYDTRKIQCKNSSKNVARGTTDPSMREAITKWCFLNIVQTAPNSTK